jgi:formyl-CoA transferase
MAALTGLRVLDISQAEAGPLCAQWLAWYGADVMRVELPASPGVPAAAREGGLYLANNMNKRSVVLDYRTAEGRELLARLVPRVDVLVENSRPGVLDGLGLGYDVLRTLHPPLIYCSITGFGRSGPYRDYPAFDPVAQAAGGAMAVTGEAGGQPLRCNFTVADTVSGTIAVTAVLAAYVRRLRTGEGELVELSMQEAQLSMLRSVLLMESPDGRLVERRGSRMTPPTDLYPCAPFGPNDHVHITAPGDRFFDRVAVAIGRPELVADERFDTHEHRLRNGPALWEIVAEWTRQHTKWEAMDTLAAAGVPASAVIDNVDMRTNPHLVERGAFVEVDHPERGTTRVVGIPVRTGASTVVPCAAPRIGEHTVEVLRDELGLSTSEVDDLLARGIAAVTGPR